MAVLPHYRDTNFLELAVASGEVEEVVKWRIDGMADDDDDDW